jgi:hypothetical protein
MSRLMPIIESGYVVDSSARACLNEGLGHSRANSVKVGKPNHQYHRPMEQYSSDRGAFRAMIRLGEKAREEYIHKV